MHGATEGVFVEAVAKVAAGKEDILAIPTAVQVGQLLLGGYGLQTEERMGVRDLAVNASRIDLVLTIDGHEIVGVRLKALETVHPVHGLRENDSAGMPRHTVIPG